MKKISVVLFAFFFLSGSLFAQIIDEQKIKSKAEDAFAEVEGSLTLHFFDALTGNPIPDANVEIEDIGDFTSDFKGRVRFSTNEMNKILKVRFSHPKYITSIFEIELMAGTLFFNRFSVSPKMKIGQLRVVLDWGKNPRDLDLHLVKENAYHISYRKMKTATDGEAKLDRDDTNSYGPETITVNSIDQNAVYGIYVHDYSNRNHSASSELAKSCASVKVFGGNNRLLYIYNVPQDLIGTKWNVFKIINGEIIGE